MQQQYQLAIVGGGMQGAALFWEAAHRGIHAVLIERGDYGAGTSANSLRVVHGGLRHLQRADVASCLQMIREQRILMRIAPPLVQPLFCAMPTSRGGKRSAAVMRTGLWLYDRLREVESLATRDTVALPPSGVRSDIGEPVDSDLRERIDTPLACWFDAQVQHAERLTLAFVNAGRRAGGEARNHTEAGTCQRRDGGFELQLRERLDQRETTLRCEYLIDCSSDWRWQPQATGSAGRYVKAVNLLLDRASPRVARGLYLNNVHVNNRLLFLTPWRGRLLVGTWYFPVHDRADLRAPLSAAELAICRRDLDAVLAQPLRREEILHAQVGYLPATDSGSADPADDLIKNGIRVTGADGIDVVQATKFTTVRGFARDTIDRLAGRGLRAAPSASHNTPITQPFDQQLFHPERLRCYAGLPAMEGEALPDALFADADRAIEHEQVGRLADLIRRRLPLGDMAPPPAAVSEALLTRLGDRRGWSAQRRQLERQLLAAEYPLMGLHDE